MGTERAMALLRGPGTPIRIGTDRDVVYEDFGPFDIGLCFKGRVRGCDVVVFVIALDIRDYVV